MTLPRYTDIPIAFGLETELAVSPVYFGADITRQMRKDKSYYKTVSDSHSKAVGLPTGGIVYIDSGDHLEHCTPECNEPKDLVMYNDWGEELLYQASTQVVPLNGIIQRHNVCHMNAQTCWGVHENYNMFSDVTENYVRHSRGGYVTSLEEKVFPGKYNSIILGPHIATRVLYCGAGGLRLNKITYLGGSPIGFLMSPRLEVQQGYLYDYKSLNQAEFVRLHIRCGDSAASKLSTYLKFATTSLITTILQAGQFTSEDIIKLRNISHKHNPNLSTITINKEIANALNSKVGARNFNKTKAMKIQRFYLHKVVSCLGQPYMPDWAEEACAKWESILIQLSTNTQLVMDKVDWAIKYNLFRGVLQEDFGISVTTAKALPRESKRPEIRARLSEMDMRYGQFGPEGIYNQLSAAGLLNDQVYTEAEYAHAKTRGPYGTRAFIRAQVAQKVGDPDRNTTVFGAEWDRLYMRYKTRSDKYIIQLVDVTKTKLAPDETTWLEAWHPGVIMESENNAKARTS